MRAEMVLEPAAAPQKYLNPNFYWIEIMGRLKPGVGLAQAQAVLAPQFRRFAEASATTERAAHGPSRTAGSWKAARVSTASGGDTRSRSTS